MYKLTFRKLQNSCLFAGAVIVSLIAPRIAQADVFYWTNIGGGAIEKTTTPSNTTTTVFGSAPIPDSLIFNSTGTQIIYSSLEGATPGVFVVNTDGTGNHRLRRARSLETAVSFRTWRSNPAATASW